MKIKHHYMVKWFHREYDFNGLSCLLIERQKDLDGTKIFTNKRKAQALAARIRKEKHGDGKVIVIQQD